MSSSPLYLTLSLVPRFPSPGRCAPGGASEMLAQELNTLLKENISSRGPAQALFEVRILIA